MPVFRVEVRAIQAGDDPTGPGVLSEIRLLGIGEVAEVRAARVFLLQGGDSVLTPSRCENDAMSDRSWASGERETRARNK